MPLTIPETAGLHVERLANGGLALVFVEILSQPDAQTLLDMLRRVMASPPPSATP